MTLEERIEALEERVAALEPPKFKKPFPQSIHVPCDCDNYGVVHVMQPHCPFWRSDEEIGA
jgi:hypothetical protein